MTEVRWQRRNVETGSAVEEYRMRINRGGGFFRDAPMRVRWFPRLKMWRVQKIIETFSKNGQTRYVDYKTLAEFPCSDLDMATVKLEVFMFAETTWRLQGER